MTDPRDAIAAVIDVFMNRFAEGDSKGMAQLYTEDGQLLPNDSDFVSGRQAIREYWRDLFEANEALGIKSAKLERLVLEGHGETAIEVGRYTLSGEGGDPMGEGKYIVIWKREGGEWKLHRDIWNNNNPAPD